MVAGFGGMPWLCGPLLAVGGGPALSWTVELWPEKWRDTTFSSVRYYGSHGDHFGNPYIWISFCGVISVAFLGLNEKDCTIILLTTQVNSGSNRMCFAVKVTVLLFCFVPGYRLCSWPLRTGQEVTESSAQVYHHNRKNLVSFCWWVGCI